MIWISPRAPTVPPIRIVRLRYLNPDHPAGEVQDFVSSAVAAAWLRGKNLEDFLIVKNGHPVTLDSVEVSEIERQLEEHGIDT